MNPETVKEQVTEKYLDEFKKELKFFQKMILFPLEGDIKKILKGETQIPEHFSDLNKGNENHRSRDNFKDWGKFKNFALNNWRNMTSFLFTNCFPVKEEEKLFKSLEGKQKQIEQETKQQLNLLAQNIKSPESVNELPSLNQQENFIYKRAKCMGVTDKGQIAYILATVKGECSFKNIREIGCGRGKNYGIKDSQTGQVYYGRGYVQLTRKENYNKFTQIIQKSGRRFKDNKGKIMGNIDLVKNPDLILQSNDLAAFILVYGMMHGSFTGARLNQYISGNKQDFVGARKIINGTNRANDYARFAKEYQKKL